MSDPSSDQAHDEELSWTPWLQITAALFGGVVGVSRLLLTPDARGTYVSLVLVAVGLAGVGKLLASVLPRALRRGLTRLLVAILGLTIAWAYLRTR